MIARSLYFHSASHQRTHQCTICGREWSISSRRNFQARIFARWSRARCSMRGDERVEVVPVLEQDGKNDHDGNKELGPLRLRLSRRNFGRRVLNGTRGFRLIGLLGSGFVTHKINILRARTNRFSQKR